MSENSIVDRKGLVSTTKPATELGAVYVLQEPVGPLYAGNDYNFWCLVVVKKGQTVVLKEQGIYAVYAVAGSAHAELLGSSQTGGKSTQANLSAEDERLRQFPSARATNQIGYFTLELRALGEVDFVGFVLLALDPGTTQFP